MRTLLKAHFDTETSNRLVSDGTMPKVIQEAVEQLKPEAAYFAPTDGERGLYFVFDLKDSAQIPPIVEPFFQLGAKVDLEPVMNLEDLNKGLSSLG